MAGLGVSASVFPVQAPSVDCSGYPANGCAVTVLVSNTGTSGFAAPFTAYFVYKNGAGQTVLIDQQPWTSSQSTVTDVFPSSAVTGGATSFSVTVSFFDAHGAPMGGAASQSFSIPIRFIVYYADVGTITISPQGISPTTGTHQGFEYVEAYWVAGTTLNVTTSAGVPPVTWGSGINDNCPASSSTAGFVCTFKVSESYSAFITSSTATVPTNSILVYASATATGVSPQVVCLADQQWTMSVPSVQCGPTAQFSLQQSAPWEVQQTSGATLQSGSGTSASLNFSSLQSKVTFRGGLASLTFTTKDASILTIGQIPYGTGQLASTSPAAGSYVCSASSSVCQPGKSVNVTLTVPSGYALTGWIVNGQEAGTKNPILVSVPDSGPTSVTANVVPIPTGGGTGNGGNSTSCTLNPSTNAGVTALVIDQDGNPVATAKVSGGGTSGVTDKSGYATLCNFPVPNANPLNKQASISVTASKTGYTAASQSVNVIEGSMASVTVVLQSNGSPTGLSLLAWAGIGVAAAAVVVGGADFAHRKKGS